MRRFLALTLSLSLLLGLAQVASASLWTQNQAKQLLADGDMEASGTGVWSAYNGSTLSKNTTDPHRGGQNLRVTYNGSANGGAIQAILTAGKTYRVQGFFRGDGTTTARAELGGTTITTTNTAWTAFVFTAKATTAVFYLYSNVSGAGQYVEFDDVQVSEYTGEIKNQDKQLVVDGDMELANTSNFAAGGGATITKDTTNPHGGIRAFRVTGLNGANAASGNILTSGKRYKVTGWARSVEGTHDPRILVGGGSYDWTGSLATTWQRIDFTVAANGASFYYWAFSSGGDSGSVEFDDIFVTEYKGKIVNTYKQLLADGDMEGTTTASWSSSNSTLSKQTTGPHNGNRVLRVDPTAYPPIASQGVLTTKKIYRATGWARSGGVAVPTLYIGTDRLAWTGTTATTWQRIDVVQSTNNTSFALGSNGSVAGQYVEFDDVSVTLVD